MRFAVFEETGLLFEPFCSSKKYLLLEVRVGEDPLQRCCHRGIERLEIGVNPPSDTETSEDRPLTEPFRFLVSPASLLKDDQNLSTLRVRNSFSH